MVITENYQEVGTEREQKVWSIPQINTLLTHMHNAGLINEWRHHFFIPYSLSPHFNFAAITCISFFQLSL